MELLGAIGIVDLAIVAVLVCIFSVYAIWQDTGLLLSVALALPIAGFVYVLFPYHSQVANALPLSSASASVAVFAFFTIMVLWVMQRTTGIANGSERPLAILITAISLTTLLLAFFYHIVPGVELYDFGPTFDALFASETHFFWIVSLALLALFVL